MSEKLVHETVQIFNSTVSSGVLIREFCTIRDSTLGSCSKIYERVSVKKTTIDSGCDINTGTYIENACIGKDVQIAPNCTIVGVTHNFSKKGIDHSDVFKDIVIREGSWVGAGAIILPGVTIGCGSVIGAGSIVNRDVPDQHIYRGTPMNFVLSPIVDKDKEV